MKTQHALRILFTLTIAAIIGCMPNQAPVDGKITVTCTTSLIADAVQRIGGERVHVECLMGPGIDPHRYTATPGDIRKLSQARIVIHHGLHLEGKLGEVLEQPRSGQMSVAVTSSLKPEQLLTSDEGDGPHDPHVWFDPRLWVECLSPITDALSSVDPENASRYSQAAAAYRDEILALDRELLALAQTIPPNRRKLVTSHDAFRYFGARYGLEVHGLLGISTASEASTKDVSKLAEFLAMHSVPAIFAETSVPSKGLQAVMDACEKKYQHRIRLVGGHDSLYSDALGEAGSPGENYLGMIRHNMNVIVSALKDQP